MSSDGALAVHARATVSTQFHPRGSGRTGPAGDPLAVTDQHCQLCAIPILRVVDASFMSAIPRATINLSCVTTAERVAD
jgi:choline dehydrogenase-like flavoprotein